MRALLLIAFAANVMLSLGSTAVLPARVAVHFGLGGHADGWAGLASSTAWSVALDTFLLCAFLASGWITGRVPSRFLNVPNKAFWSSEENRAELGRKTAACMASYGILMFAFLLGVKVLVIAANRAEPVRLNEPAFFAMLGLYAVGTAVWLIWFYKAFRVDGERRRYAL